MIWVQPPDVSLPDGFAFVSNHSEVADPCWIHVWWWRHAFVGLTPVDDIGLTSRVAGVVEGCHPLHVCLVRQCLTRQLGVPAAAGVVL